MVKWRRERGGSIASNIAGYRSRASGSGPQTVRPGGGVGTGHGREGQAGKVGGGRPGG